MRARGVLIHSQASCAVLIAAVLSCLLPPDYAAWQVFSLVNIVMITSSISTLDSTFSSIARAWGVQVTRPPLSSCRAVPLSFSLATQWESFLCTTSYCVAAQSRSDESAATPLLCEEGRFYRRGAAPSA